MNSCPKWTALYALTILCGLHGSLQANCLIETTLLANITLCHGLPNYNLSTPMLKLWPCGTWTRRLEVMHLIGDDIRTIKINANVLLNACKDIGLAVNIGKTKYMEIGRHRGMMANAHIKIGSNSYEKVKTLLSRLFIDKSKFYSGGNKM